MKKKNHIFTSFLGPWPSLQIKNTTSYLHSPFWLSLCGSFPSFLFRGAIGCRNVIYRLGVVFGRQRGSSRREPAAGVETCVTGTGTARQYDLNVGRCPG